MTPSTPSALMAAVATPWNRSRQTTSLASRRSPCVARRSPAAVASCVSFVSRNVSSIPWMPETRRSSAWIGVRVRRRERPGRVDVARALDVELLLLEQAAELRLELRLREARRREQRREVGADLRGVLADGVDLAHVVAVGDLLLLGRAALHPHGEEDDHEDRERDERREAEQRRQRVRPAERCPRRPAAAAGRAASGRPWSRLPRRRRELARLVVDEVEVEDVVVVHRHG